LTPALRRIPAWAWLVAIVVGSAVVRMALVGRIVTPWIMVDELIYSELAKSFAADGHFVIRGVPSSGYGFVYPILIAPAFRIHTAVPAAYHAAKLVNAALMSLAAVPVYFLARRLLSPALSLLAALLTVLVPSMLYTGMLMTENAFYPLFLTCLLLLQLTLERPTRLRQVLLLAACALAFATRAQAVVLFGAAFLAPILYAWYERDLRGVVRRFSLLYGILVGGAVLALAWTVARGHSLSSLLGAYAVAAQKGYTFSDVADYTLRHAAELDLYVGVIGLAALLAMWFAPRSESQSARAFAATTLPVSVLLLVEVAAFASTQSFRIEERNDFYLAPLAVIAMLGLASRSDVVTTSRRALVPAALIAGVLPVAVQFGRFVTTAAVSDTFALLPWWWWQDHGVNFHDLQFIALAGGLVAAAAFLLVPRRFALVFPLLVGALFVVTSVAAENGRHGIHTASVGSLWGGIRNSHPDWIDRAVGSNADVSFLWHYTGETRPLWNNEFFSRSVGTVYTVDGPDPADGGLAETPVHERPDGTLTTASGRAPLVDYAVSYVDIAGRPVAGDPRIGLTLFRVRGPLVILTRVTGLYPNDTWGGRRVTYRRERCTGGTLAVRVGTDAQLFDRMQTIDVTSGGRTSTVRIAPADQPTAHVPLEPRNGVCTVTFVARTVRVPGGGDDRPLAAHYYAFDYRP
jgi:Dolichyl-phosphate-mannose-protein mannosyltransferase